MHDSSSVPKNSQDSATIAVVKYVGRIKVRIVVHTSKYLKMNAYILVFLGKQL